jgi:hypothetical protein
MIIQPDHDEWLICKVKDKAAARRFFGMPNYWPVEEIKETKDKQGQRLFRVLSLFGIKSLFER